MQDQQKMNRCCEDDIQTHPALLNELVLSKIFSYLHVPDLLACSGACKVWNIEARNLLRRMALCNLSLRKENHAPEKLRSLIQVLQSSRNIFYTGISITYDCNSSSNNDESYVESMWKQLEQLIVQSLGRNLRSLKLCVNFQKPEPPYYNPVSPAPRGLKDFIVNLFASTHAQVEDLLLEGNVSTVFKDQEKSYRFVVLQKLKNFEFKAPFRSDMKFCKRIACAAPNLRKLEGFVSPDWLFPLISSTRRPEIVKQLICKIYPEDFDLMLQFARSLPELEKLVLQSSVFEDESLIDVLRYEIFPTLLQSSEKTLRELEIEFVELQRLYTSGILGSFPQLWRLRIAIPLSDTAMTALQGIQWAVHFPSLRQVEIRGDFSLLQGETASVMKRYCCATVKDLVIINGSGTTPITDSVIAALRANFPDVRRFGYQSNDSNPRGIFQALHGQGNYVWPESEEITILGTRECDYFTLAELMCSIAPGSLRRLCQDESAKVRILSDASYLHNSKLRTFRVEILEGMVHSDGTDCLHQPNIQNILKLAAQKRHNGATFHLFCPSHNSSQLFPLEFLKPDVTFVWHCRRYNKATTTDAFEYNVFAEQ